MDEQSASCGGCALRGACERVDSDPRGRALSGGRLAGWAVACFLVPVAAAATAAALVEGATASVLAALGGFVVTAAAAAVGARRLGRGREKEVPQR